MVGYRTESCRTLLVRVLGAHTSLDMLELRERLIADCRDRGASLPGKYNISTMLRTLVRERTVRQERYRYSLVPMVYRADTHEYGWRVMKHDAVIAPNVTEDEARVCVEALNELERKQRVHSSV